MKIDYINKSRLEQDEDFKNVFSHYADVGCKECKGTGKMEWIPEIRQYRLCVCVSRNIRDAIKEREEIMEMLIN